MPVAIGSRVPAWPAFWASKIRRTAPTTWVDVMPWGLSITTQPWIGWPFFLRPIAVVIIRCRKIALHPRGFQDRLDLLCLGEGLVLDEAQVGRELERDPATELATQEALVAVERSDDLLGVLTA